MARNYVTIEVVCAHASQELKALYVINAWQIILTLVTLMDAHIVIAGKE